VSLGSPWTGATVVAIDIPGSWGKGGARPTSSLWKRLCSVAKASPGSLVFPLSTPQAACASEQDLHEAAGCDLMKQPGEIANWLVAWQKSLPPSAKVISSNYPIPLPLPLPLPTPTPTSPYPYPDPYPYP